MSLLGLFAWLCLLVSCFAHLSTFFQGGASLSSTSLLVMHSLAAALIVAAYRRYKQDGKPFKTAVPASSLIIFAAVSLYVGASAYQVSQRPLLETSSTPAAYEVDQRLSARAWTGLWILAYLVPVLFFHQRVSDGPEDC